MAPHWDDSPYWARWLAQDANGDWFWFETEPNPHRGMQIWVRGPGYGNTAWSRKTALVQDWTTAKWKYPALPPKEKPAE